MLDSLSDTEYELYKSLKSSASRTETTKTEVELYPKYLEIQDLKAIDRDYSGTIDQNELLALRDKRVKLSGGEKMIELFTTHPNMLKRIKRLAMLVGQ